MDNNGCKPIAIGHLSDSDDVKKKSRKVTMKE